MLAIVTFIWLLCYEPESDTATTIIHNDGGTTVVAHNSIDGGEIALVVGFVFYMAAAVLLFLYGVFFLAKENVKLTGLGITGSAYITTWQKDFKYSWSDIESAKAAGTSTLVISLKNNSKPLKILKS